ncbi:MAG: helix-turn-helix domain-containing protein [Betaproteobacteria bacterium]
MTTAPTVRLPDSVIPPVAAGITQSSTQRASCSNCNLRELCLTGGLCATDLERVQTIVHARRRVKRGESIFHAGDTFGSVYAIRSGFFKSSVVDDDGREQVTGFCMGGELLGMEGIGAGTYNATATALEDSEVCVMPYGMIEEMSFQVRPLQRLLHAVMAREIVRDQGIMMLLGSMRAEERLAVFLLNLSQRFAVRGYSHADFLLRMTREELGSYLGLKLETVSRVFSKFQEAGILTVQQKHIRITDFPGLKTISGQCH